MGASTPPTIRDVAPVLELTHVSKSFAGTRALDDVSLSVNVGEVHGLLGENGSGKSTLIKVLSGYHAPDPGAECRVGGEAIELPIPPGEAKRLGLSFVHQDLGLVPSLSVLENLRLTELSTSHARWINWQRERQRAKEVLDRFDVAIDPRTNVSDLGATERALLAIVRAVEGMRSVLADETRRGLLVLDEPTVFLPAHGIERLFTLLRDVVQRHASVLFVSHNLEEVRRITDRVTVLRDGRVRGTVVTKQVGEAELIDLIVGRAVAGAGSDSKRAAPRDARTLLSVKGLCGPIVDDVSFDIRAGEVIGLTGVLGSGFVDVIYHLFGARACSQGTVVAGDRSLRAPDLTPRKAIALGIALVPGDRAQEGSVGSLSVGDNVMLQVVPSFQRLGLLRRRALESAAAEVLDRFDVRPNDATKTYRLLSGGNQQKALVARWVQAAPQIFLMHEPTQGVDIGARNQIFDLVREITYEGASVVCASSDYDQLAAICHRVLIFENGRLKAEVGQAQLGKGEIMAKVYEGVNGGSKSEEVWGR